MRIILIILLLLFFPMAKAQAAVSAKKAVKKGNLMYNKGNFAAALDNYQDAFLDSPESGVVNFNLGTALYKTNEYRSAIEHFERSLLVQDKLLEQKASYNLGNAEYKFGLGMEKNNLSEAIDLLKKSLRHYQHALEINPQDEDAKYNYQFVQKELERLMKQQQQQQEQQSQAQDQNSQQPQQKEFESNDNQAESAQEQQQMSQSQALKLLEKYSQQEPKGLYKEKMPALGLPEVDKDW